MSSKIYCGAVVPYGQGRIETYKGLDGVTYQVVNRECFELTQATSTIGANASDALMTVEITGWTDSVMDTLFGQGVILYQGKEIVSFYGTSNRVVAYPLLPFVPVERELNVPGNVLQPGEYCILTFEIPRINLNAPVGTVQLCLRENNLTTPVPTATFVPTPQPTVTRS